MVDKGSLSKNELQEDKPIIPVNIVQYFGKFLPKD